jgi:type I restriction enzyme S subunit
MWAWMGALGTAKEDGLCCPAYGVYKPKKYKPYSHSYFDYLYRTPNAIIEMTRNSKGIVSSRLRLYPKDFFQILTALPLKNEQKAIADYLDEKTAKIDQQIDLLSQMAKHYGELKQALINETVTRGLDKTVPMKDSGIEWIGEIPAHWEEKRAKDISSITMGQSPSSDDYTEEEFGYPFLQGNAEFGNLHPTPKVWCSVIKKWCKPHDILLSVRAPVGAVNVANAQYGIGRGLCAIQPNSVMKYWYFVFASATSFLNSIGTGSTYLAISVEDVRNISLAIPPTKEREQIANYLDDKTAQIDAIIEAIIAQIVKLKELRKTLINDVVTGKIKVV